MVVFFVYVVVELFVVVVEVVYVFVVGVVVFGVSVFVGREGVYRGWFVCLVFYYLIWLGW